MKFLILATVLISSAASANIDITTGGKGGYYYGTLGSNTAKVMRERGMPSQIHESRGGVQNLDRLVAGQADLAFAQADTVKAYTDNNPNAALEDIATLGKECIFMAVKEGGKVSKAQDLKKDTLVYAGKQGSGGESSLRYLMSMNKNINPQIALRGGTRALNQVKQGKADAMIWVQSPTKLDTRELQLINQKDSGLTLAEIDLDGIFSSAKLPSGEAIYSFEKVKYASGWGNNVTTACTSIVAMVNVDNMDDDQVDKIADLLNLNKTRITGGK